MQCTFIVLIKLDIELFYRHQLNAVVLLHELPKKIYTWHFAEIVSIAVEVSISASMKALWTYAVAVWNKLALLDTRTYENSEVCSLEKDDILITKLETKIAFSVDTNFHTQTISIQINQVFFCFCGHKRKANCERQKPKCRITSWSQEPSYKTTALGLPSEIEALSVTGLSTSIALPENFIIVARLLVLMVVVINSSKNESRTKRRIQYPAVVLVEWWTLGRQSW